MSSQLQNVQINLKELVNNINSGIYTIPKFQRNFVWKKGDIESLGDSLIRGYPISSMLTMAMNGNLEVGFEPLKTSGYKVSKDINNEGIYVLDGQQRITSVAKIFANLDTSNTYYFDLVAILKDKYPKDNIEKILIKGNENFFKSKIEENTFCRAFSNGKSDYQPSRQKYRFISGKTVAEDKFGSSINKFLKNFSDEDEETIDKYNDYLTALFGAMTSYGIQVTEIHPSADLGLICRVFEKVNSTGIKLTTFDLINAKSFNSQKISSSGGLSAYIAKDINEEIENINDHFAGDFLSYSIESNSFKELSKIIRSLFLSNCLEENKNPYLTQASLLSKNSDFWVDNWDKNKNVFFKFLNILNEEKLTALLPTAFLEYVIGIVFAYPKSIENPAFIKMVKKNGLALSIMGNSMSKSEIDMFDSMIDFTKKIINKEVYSYDNCLFVHFDLPKIEKIFQGQKAFNSIFYIMTNEHNSGKFTVDISGHQISPNKNKIDAHHLIPKSKIKNKGDIFKSVINFVPLDSYVNREEVKDSNPTEYFENLKRQINYNYIMEQNLIPNKISDDESFLIERKILVENFIKDYFK